MKTSIVIRTKDEADRLRLTLASLTRQTQQVEVVVVDDGSSDHTPQVIAEAETALPLVTLRHECAQGRSAASNAGARAARGDVLLFLDGDNLAHPDLVRLHAAAHRRQPGLIGRGETFQLRCTRFLRDPETGAPMPDEAARVARLRPSELRGMLITRLQVLEDFASIEGRAEPGIYPGAGPRRLQELELAALRNNPDCTVLWAAASGCNQSTPREAFLAAGGFDEKLNINEHRELALRLCKAGLNMGVVDGAKSYHMTHRAGWRDPLQDMAWHETFFNSHPSPDVALLPVFWDSLSPMTRLPEAARIHSLPELAAAARSWTSTQVKSACAVLGISESIH